MATTNASPGWPHCSTWRPNLLENLSDLDPVLGIKTVIRRPILLGAVLVAQQAGDGVPPKTDQMGKAVAAGPGKGLAVDKGIGTLLHQVFDFLEKGGVFFKAIGLGGTCFAGENQVALVGDGPLHVFALGKIHALGDGRRKVDVPLLAFLALNELNFSWITHNGLY